MFAWKPIIVNLTETRGSKTPGFEETKQEVRKLFVIKLLIGELKQLWQMDFNVGLFHVINFVPKVIEQIIF